MHVHIDETPLGPLRERERETETEKSYNVTVQASEAGKELVFLCGLAVAWLPHVRRVWSSDVGLGRWGVGKRQSAQISRIHRSGARVGSCEGSVINGSIDGLPVQEGGRKERGLIRARHTRLVSAGSEDWRGNERHKHTDAPWCHTLVTPFLVLPPNDAASPPTQCCSDWQTWPTEKRPMPRRQYSGSIDATLMLMHNSRSMSVGMSDLGSSLLLWKVILRDENATTELMKKTEIRLWGLAQRPGEGRRRRTGQAQDSVFCGLLMVSGLGQYELCGAAGACPSPRRPCWNQSARPGSS
ncbi:hypothetical protein DFP72DRAFT_850400 [Ephemerocybe angulata]|uniref:Uncharacterized protein n=1 Tax=Ephemerocybe angulata TaxID=980116 RepID=A0A8H6HSB6_9AGAR|nr:hypothetical protein DFP72DRAFT_850400 [Tulosesus angulatus]